jgi:hypothetical protein
MTRTRRSFPLFGPLAAGIRHRSALSVASSPGVASGSASPLAATAADPCDAFPSSAEALTGCPVGERDSGRAVGDIGTFY